MAQIPPAKTFHWRFLPISSKLLPTPAAMSVGVACNYWNDYGITSSTQPTAIPSNHIPNRSSLLSSTQDIE